MSIRLDQQTAVLYPQSDALVMTPLSGTQFPSFSHLFELVTEKAEPQTLNGKIFRRYLGSVLFRCQSLRATATPPGCLPLNAQHGIIEGKH
jgi:hypothetical protein